MTQDIQLPLTVVDLINFTIQDIFDILWNYYITQKSPPAVLENGVSAFFGTKSFGSIGPLIPKDIYKPDFEGKMVKDLFEKHENMRTIFFGIDIEFLSDIDDEYMKAVVTKTKPGQTFSSKLETNLRKVAQKFNLKVPGEN